MGTICVKPQKTDQYSVQQIDFHALFQQKLNTPKADYYKLLNFLTKTDVKYLVYIVKALFHPNLKQQIADLVLSIADQVDSSKPPAHLMKLIEQNTLPSDKNPQKAKPPLTKSINPPTTNLSNYYDPYRGVNDAFQRSSCPIEDQREESFQLFQPGFIANSNQDLIKMQREIEDRIQMLSDALRGAQRVCEVEKSRADRLSQCHSSFISRGSKISPHHTMRNIMDGSQRMHATSFYSTSPKNNTQPKQSLKEITFDLKKSHSNQYTIQDKKQIQLENKNKVSDSNKIPLFQPEQSPPVDKYIEIRDFYEGQIAKYKQQLEYLKNRMVIWQKENQSSERSNIFSSLMSKDSKSSIINRDRTSTMKICSGQVNHQIKEEIQQTMEYGTKMTLKQNSHISSDSQQSDHSDRKHAKSLIIRLFRDSKIFPIEYSKKFTPTNLIGMRQKIEQMFSTFYTQKVYTRNPIQFTNMIFQFEERLPKKFIDYLKNYKTWILIGKVNEKLCIGAFINLKNADKSHSEQAFLFSLPEQGSPYILKAKNKIKDPLIKPENINFGDSQFRINNGTKKVHLGLQNFNMNFVEEDGSEPNTRRFTMGLGENIQLQQLEIHQIIFADSFQ